MDLRLIEIFIEAARRQSFSAAARVLQVTPAAVSQSVRSLEERLGARLFTRTTRNVRLTDEGRRYFERVEPALRSLTSAAEALAEERDEMRGPIRISSTTAFGRTHALPVLRDFMAAHPGIDIELSLSDQFVDLVGEGFDFAIRAGALPQNDYVSRLLLPITRLVCASPDYARAHGLPQRIEDIARHRCIGMRSNPSQRVFPWEFVRGRLPITLEVSAAALIVNDPQAAGEAAAAGVGLVQLGSNVVMPMVAQGRLVTCLDTFVRPNRGIYAVYPSRRYLPKRVSALLEALTQHFAERTDLLPGASRVSASTP
jgi:DNA-binding transcriptional LysR family regulator